MSRDVIDIEERADASAEFVAALVASQRRLYAFIGTLLPVAADLEDVYQQTCLALWKKRSQYDPGRDFLPWACGFARNEVLKFVQRNRRQGVHLSEHMIDCVAADLEQSDSSTADRLAALDGCLEKLDPRQRSLVERCYQGTEPIKSVAHGMGLSPAALTMRLQRIRHALARCVERATAAAGEP